MGFDTGKKVQEAGVILGGLGVIGFLGLIWLMIYGNLDGNLGFTTESETITGENFTLSDTAYTLAQYTLRLSRTNLVISSVSFTNTTGGETVPTTNYTLSTATVTALTGPYNQTQIDGAYTLTWDSFGKANTESVINNITGGFLTFFGFSDTFFIIAAITLLIFMLLGLLALAMLIMNMQKGGKGLKAKTD